MLKQKKIAIIGTGNLGSSVARGLIKEGFPASNIYLADKMPEALKAFDGQGVNISTDSNQVIKNSDIVILAVKPYTAKEVFHEIGQSFSDGQMIVSVISGT